MSDKAVLTIGDKGYDLPILKGTTGPDVVDVRKLYGETDMFTFDPAFTSTASCESKITYIDGDAGMLLHRGYPIEQLADNSQLPGKSRTCCCTANCPRPGNSRTSPTPSRGTPCCTPSSTPSSRASAATRTRWR